MAVGDLGLRFRVYGFIAHEGFIGLYGLGFRGL